MKSFACCICHKIFSYNFCIIIQNLRRIETNSSKSHRDKKRERKKKKHGFTRLATRVCYNISIGQVTGFERHVCPSIYSQFVLGNGT